MYYFETFLLSLFLQHIASHVCMLIYDTCSVEKYNYNY